jgi:hypothetical protein
MMTADQAREVIAQMEAEVKSPARRKSQAAFFSTNIFGKLSPEAVAVYREYAERK